MDMVGGTADPIAFALCIAGNSGKVGVEVGANGWIEQGTAVLGAENRVHDYEAQ